MYSLKLRLIHVASFGKRNLALKSSVPNQRAIEMVSLKGKRIEAKLAALRN